MLGNYASTRIISSPPPPGPRSPFLCRATSTMVIGDPSQELINLHNYAMKRLVGGTAKAKN